MWPKFTTDSSKLVSLEKYEAGLTQLIDEDSVYRPLEYVEKQEEKKKYNRLFTVLILGMVMCGLLVLWFDFLTSLHTAQPPLVAKTTALSSVNMTLVRARNTDYIFVGRDEIPVRMSHITFPSYGTFEAELELDSHELISLEHKATYIKDVKLKALTSSGSVHLFHELHRHNRLYQASVIRSHLKKTGTVFWQKHMTNVYDPITVQYTFALAHSAEGPWTDVKITRTFRPFMSQTTKKNLIYQHNRHFFNNEMFDEDGL